MKSRLPDPPVYINNWFVPVAGREAAAATRGQSCPDGSRQRVPHGGDGLAGWGAPCTLPPKRGACAPGEPGEGSTGREAGAREEGRGGCPGAAGTLGGAAVMNGASKPSLAVFPFLPNTRPRSRRMIHSLSTTQHSVHRNGREHWEMGNSSWGRSGSPLSRPLRLDSPRVATAMPTTSSGTQLQSCLPASAAGPGTRARVPARAGGSLAKRNL